MNRCHAFTLIELLVVVGIIATLSALLIPVIGLVRTGAQRTNCGSQQRQVVLAINAYAGDNDNRLVSFSASVSATDSRNWNQLLDPYAETALVSGATGNTNVDNADAAAAMSRRSIIRCPQFDANRDYAYAALKTDKSQWGAGYGMVPWFPNGYDNNGAGKVMISTHWSERHNEVGNGVRTRNIKLSAITGMSTRPFGGDSVSGAMQVNGGDTCLIDGSTSWDVNQRTVVGFIHVAPHDGGKTCDDELRMIAGAPKRHGGKAVYFFLDGHVEVLSHLVAARTQLYPWVGR
jgi:prepilin-type N-terminal cleavage/methylation domain-containing protein/prepilin-type processing-associated H-X9-DG protein